MSPVQRELYRRYHYIVVNDNTAQTNSLNMPLNVFVVVDNDGKTRVVACALLSAETIVEYAWGLKQLMEASKGSDGVVRALDAILVDEDLALDLALRSEMPQSKVINCIWHIAAHNVPKNLRSALGTKRYGGFIVRFWHAQKTLTEEEFQREWQELQDEYGTGSTLEN